MATTDTMDAGGVAVVGMACRVPGARDVGAFWENLCGGVESVTELTDAGLRQAGELAELIARPNYVRTAPVLDDIDAFDAAFFQLSPSDARVIDPQQRIFLELAWEALEHAGWVPEVFAGSIGVYAGASTSQYGRFIRADSADAANPYALFGNEKDYLSTQLSHRLNLTGPSIGVQTACSTALVAVHLACQSLLNGECDMALAGGVSIAVPQGRGYLFEETGSASPDGHCRAFDARGHGGALSSGAGLVVLRRLADALESGETIHAVIKGSAVNNDGARKVSYAAPGLDSQARVVREALAVAGCDPATIGYVEANGTGTKLGDAIEIAALTRAFTSKTARPGPCLVGSVKTNIGHMSVASGVASLIKAVLAVENGQIPPSLNFEAPNSRIDFAGSPFVVATKLHPWPLEQGPRRAGVSAFGIGGTNAHIVLERGPEPTPTPTPTRREPHLLALSARSASALGRAAGALAAHLERHPEQSFADVCHTLLAGRRRFDCRAAIVCCDARTAIESLARFTAGTEVGVRTLPGKPKVVFVFAGEAAAAPEIGRELYERESAFRVAVDQCLGALRRVRGRDVVAAQLWALPATQEVSRWAELIVSYGLAQLWTAWGVEPGAVASSGASAPVAACVAGILSLEDALATALEVPRPAALTLRPPAVPLHICGPSGWLSSEVAVDPAAWKTPWRPSQSQLAELLQDQSRVLLHLGPAPRCSAAAGEVRSVHGSADLLQALARLFELGVDFDGAARYRGERRHRVPLPTYPFERQRFWIDSPSAASAAAPTPRPSFAPAPIRSLSEVERELAAIWKDILGVERAERGDTFYGLGASSLRALEVQRRIQAAFGVNLQLSIVLGDLCLADLATAVVYSWLHDGGDSLRSRIEAMSEDDANRVLHYGKSLGQGSYERAKIRNP